MNPSASCFYLTRLAYSPEAWRKAPVYSFRILRTIRLDAKDCRGIFDFTWKKKACSLRLVCPDNGLNSPTFGKIFNSSDPRIIQVALKYVF